MYSFHKTANLPVSSCCHREKQLRNDLYLCKTHNLEGHDEPLLLPLDLTLSWTSRRNSLFFMQRRRLRQQQRKKRYNWFETEHIIVLNSGTILCRSLWNNNSFIPGWRNWKHLNETHKNEELPFTRSINFELQTQDFTELWNCVTQEYVVDWT